MKTTTNNRKFLKLFFLAIALTAFSGMRAQWTTNGEYVQTNWNNLILNADADAQQNGSSKIKFQLNGGLWDIFANDVQFGVSNSNETPYSYSIPFRINKTSDNVCIGCALSTVPTHKLHVNGAVRATTALIGASGTSAFFGNVNALDNPGLIATNYSLMQGLNGGSYLNASTGATVNFRINNVDQAIVSDTKINLLNNVGIGIGTATPTHKLQVNGNVRADNAIIGNLPDDTSFFGNVNALNNAGFNVKNYSLKQGPNGGSYLNASTGSNVHLAVNDVPEVIVSAAETKILNNLIVESSGMFGSNHHIKGATSFGAEKMPAFAATVSIDGRLLISDTDAPHKAFTAFASENYKDYLLWVQEGVVATDYAVATLSQWPDYVFNKEYKLNSLNEVASFIKANGHLPTMPSAKEIEKNGFTLSDMTKRTVKTIEELTLHTIEQQKLIENQAQLIESLAKRLNALEAKQ